MSTTHIPAGDPLARKVFGAALFAATQRQNTLTNNLTGTAPKQGDAESKLSGQTTPDMPFVRVTDLSKTQGDKVTVDLIDIVGGKPIMGDRNAQGKGEKLSFSTQEIGIDLTTKVVDAGGKMTQQRTVHNLRGIAMAQLKGYFGRLQDQRTMIHLAGARGDIVSRDWTVPLQNDADFNEIMVNPVLAPSFDRHFVVDGNALVKGGQQLGSIDSTDVMKLSHIDEIATIIADSEFKLQPVKLPGDPAAEDEPMYVCFVTHRIWNQLLTDGTASNNWRTFLQNAWTRASYGVKHPLFTGETGMWRNIVFKKIDRSIRFLPGSSTNIITSANRFTGTESAQTVNAGMTAGFGVERMMIVGAQALAHVYGRNQTSDTFCSWYEQPYNFGRAMEVAGDCMGGSSKVRLSVADSTGNRVALDHGVYTIDVAVKL